MSQTIKASKNPIQWHRWIQTDGDIREIENNGQIWYLHIMLVMNLHNIDIMNRNHGYESQTLQRTLIWNHNNNTKYKQHPKPLELQ